MLLYEDCRLNLSECLRHIVTNVAACSPCLVEVFVFPAIYLHYRSGLLVIKGVFIFVVARFVIVVVPVASSTPLFTFIIGPGAHLRRRWISHLHYRSGCTSSLSVRCLPSFIFNWKGAHLRRRWMGNYRCMFTGFLHSYSLEIIAGSEIIGPASSFIFNWKGAHLRRRRIGNQ